MENHNHQGNERAYMRDIILGINDGLISTFLLTIGIYASGLSKPSILLTIISCSLSGMISMGLGEYMATKSQKEVMVAELAKEELHIETHLEVELEQVRYFLEKELYIQDEFLVQNFINTIQQNKQGLFNFMKKVEFGITEEDERRPWVAGLVSGFLFFLGSTPTLVAFALPMTIKSSFYTSLALNGLTLFIVGSGKTLMTKTLIFFSGLENLVYGSLGAAFSYGIGYFFSQHLVGDGA